MFDYLFIDNESGEYFFVECSSLEDAWHCVGDGDVEYLGKYSVEEAEILGYDTI